MLWTITSGPAVHGGEQPNVLFISIDDLRVELNTYGQTWMHTPAIDALAREGVQFDRAYSQMAICHPSRASVLTGKRPESVGITTLRMAVRTAAPEVVTLPQHFRAHGYVAESFGKVFHHGHGHRGDPESWSRRPHWFAGGVLYANPANLEHDRTNRAAAEARRASGDTSDQPRHGPVTERHDDPEGVYMDTRMNAAAIRGLRRLAQGDQPFFLAVGYAKPHLPFNAPTPFWDLYDPAKITLASQRTLPHGTPAIAGHDNGELRSYAGVPRDGIVSTEQEIELRHGYYACVSYVDALIGDLLAELDDLGLRDNTVVVLWSDHGFKLGDYGMWHKHTNFELDCRVPLIISAPGHRNGVRTPAIVELLDLYPTLCELAGLPVPSEVEGLSLTPTMTNPDTVIKPAAYSQHDRGKRIMGYSARSDRYRYTEWRIVETGQAVGVELYDHLTDRGETVNQSDNDSYAAAQAEMARLLAQGFPNSIANWPAANRE
ncbi:MAG: sulfatase [Planctomycetota bacterium]